MGDSLQNDPEKTAKELAIQAGFRFHNSAYNNDQLEYWIKKTLNYINENLGKNGPIKHSPIFDTKGTPILGTVVKMKGNNLLVKGGSIGFHTSGETTSPLDPGSVEINKGTTAYMELTDIEGIIHKFSGLLFNRGTTGTTRMWRHNDSSRIINWIRSTVNQAEGSAPITAEGDATTNSGGTVRGTLMSDDNMEFVIGDALTN